MLDNLPCKHSWIHTAIIVYSINNPNYFFRLLDIFHIPMVLAKEIHLNLVFEHVEQDLAAYIDDCPPPGISEWKVKVRHDIEELQTPGGGIVERA